MADEQRLRPSPSGWLDRAFQANAWAGLILWCFVFSLLWLFAPAPVRWIAPGWALLGALAPNLYLLSLALALPFFGNNPGGAHALYLLDMGLMGFVVRDLIARIQGRRFVRPSPFNGLVRLFVLVSALTLYPQLLFIYCEASVEGSRFFFSIYNHYATAPMFGMRAWLDLALAASMFAALRDEPMSARWRSRFWIALLAGLAVASVLGLMDYAGLLSLESWRALNPEITRFGYRRLQSLFWHSGWFAQYLAVLAPATLAFGLAHRRGESRGAVAGRVWLGLAGLLAVAQLLTFQRGGWLALLAGYAVVALAHSAGAGSARRRRMLKRGALAVGAAFLVIVTLATAIPPLRHRLSQIANIEDRSRIWGAGYRIALGYPLIGVGIGNFFSAHQAFFPYGHENYELDKVTAHNTYLQVFAERGILELGIFCLLFFGAIVRLWFVHRQSAGGVGAARGSTGQGSSAIPPDRSPPGAEAGGDRGGREGGGATPGREHGLPGEIVALLGCLVALAVYSLFQSIFYIRLVELIFWIFLAWAFAPSKSATWDRRAPVARARVWPWAVATLVIAGVVGVTEIRSFFWKWNFSAGGQLFTAGGAEVRLKVSGSANTVLVPVYCNDPSASLRPVIFTFELDGTRLASVVFRRPWATSVRLELPAERDPASPLIVRSSRIWSPYRDGRIGRRIPVLEAGVHYAGPVTLD